MEVIVPGEGTVRLTNQHFKTRGGEGDIYFKGQTVYKIYFDHKAVPPAAKMQELAVLRHPQIIIPEQPIFNTRQNKLVGFTMRKLDNTEPLCKLFTRAFRQRQKISDRDVLDLVKQLHGLISFIHKRQILVVDLNELNFLLGKDKLFAIDTNSYQTPSFPATAIMPHIADAHCNNRFSETTDWFSFGIVSFQMLTGIHPYKGTNPDFDSVPKDQRLFERMRKNVSVLNPKTTVPAICQLSIIPQGLLAWYTAVFEDGKRINPPDNYEVSIVQIVTPPRSVPISGGFTVRQVFRFDSEIIDVLCFSGDCIVQTRDSVFLNKRRICSANGDRISFLRTRSGNGVPVKIVQKPLSVFDLQMQSSYDIKLSADDVLLAGQDLYVRQGTSVVQLSFNHINDRMIIGNKVVGRVLDSTESTQVFPGFVLQNLLGRYFVSLFENEACFQLSIPELDGYKVIEARRIEGVIVLLAVRNGQYDRFVLISQDGKQYSIRKTEDVSYLDINFSVLPNGLVVLMGDDGKLEVSSVHSSKANLMDAGEVSGCDLYSDGMQMLFAKGDTLFAFSMGKK